MLKRIFFIAFLGGISISVAADESFYEQMKVFVNSNFPGEQFVPIPHGSDGRYEPRSIWLFADGLAKDIEGTKKTTGWIYGTDGVKIYGDVKATSKPVTLQTVDMELKQRKSFILALTAVFALGSVEAALDYASESGYKFNVNVEEARIDELDFTELLKARNVNSDLIKKIDSDIRNGFGGKIKDARTVISSLRVRGAKIEFAPMSTTSFGVNAKADLDKIKSKVTEGLGNAGFKLQSEESNGFSLYLNDWKTIAFKAVYFPGETLIAGSAADLEKKPNQMELEKPIHVGEEITALEQFQLRK